MKKRGILVFIAIFLTTGCSNYDYHFEIPDGYIYKVEFYDDNSFQDYTDYAKYIYSSNEVIVNDEKYKIVEKTDIENIKKYFNNFYNQMKKEKRLEEYDFNLDMINEGDYIRIRKSVNKEADIIEPPYYDYYSLYFFDIETLTLYYIHYDT